MYGMVNKAVEAMVCSHFGLIRGLATMFVTETETIAVRTRECGADHDEFLVQWKSATGNA